MPRARAETDPLEQIAIARERVSREDARNIENAERISDPVGSECALASLLARIRACRICIDTPAGRPLPHAPNPVLRPSRTARLCIASQAPGVRVHASGTPFTDPSGDRLRAWLGVTPDEFYDVARVAIVPMGFCFPGHDAAGGDLPPRKECAPAWHAQLFAAMPQLDLVLLVGSYAQAWHRPRDAAPGMTAMVRNWRAVLDAPTRPRYLPLPHPSWRNNGWLARNPWFEAELLPTLRQEVRRLL
ncbi:MAG: uracil-DNA glycosylase family protein [Hyphomicrobiaceae bacterium]|nr:uracil-DNA glycosylase family protein [Hyphomicrobiaceae bacterium]